MYVAVPEVVRNVGRLQGLLEYLIPPIRGGVEEHVGIGHKRTIRIKGERLAAIGVHAYVPARIRGHHPNSELSLDRRRKAPLERGPGNPLGR